LNNSSSRPIICLLEELLNKTGGDLQPEDGTNDGTSMPLKKVTVIDRMAVVQIMGKPPWIKTCAQWADHFTAILDSKCSDYDKTHLVFDHCDLFILVKKST